MFNPYSVILGLFIVAGVLATIWGLRILFMARKSQQWPSVEGLIEESDLSSARDDLLPHIIYSYSVSQQSYRQAMKFSGDITPTQEFAQSYVDKYPVGSRVQVYYNPAKPEIATLEPGMGKGDWLILVIGLVMILFGFLLLLVNG